MDVDAAARLYTEASARVARELEPGDPLLSIWVGTLQHAGYGLWLSPLEARAVLWRVQQGFLDTALAIIDADHGGIERYLTQRLRLTPAALRALASRYLQPSDTT